MPTEEQFNSQGNTRLRIWNESTFNKGPNPLAYLQPPFFKKYTDFPTFTSYWDLRDNYEVAYYASRVAPTGQFEFWTKYRPNAIASLFDVVDGLTVSKTQVSPILTNGFYKRGATMNQFYIAPIDSMNSIIRITYEFRPLSQINFAAEFSVNTGNKLRDFAFNAVGKLGQTSEDIQEQSEPDEDEKFLSGLLSAFKDLIFDSNISDIFGLWVPISYSITQTNIPVFNPNGKTSGASKKGDIFGLLPAGLVGVGLITGNPLIAVAGAGWLLLSNRTNSESNTSIRFKNGRVDSDPIRR